jgi:hypothetical protein
MRQFQLPSPMVNAALLLYLRSEPLRVSHSTMQQLWDRNDLSGGPAHLPTHVFDFGLEPQVASGSGLG